MPRAPSAGSSGSRRPRCAARAPAAARCSSPCCSGSAPASSSSGRRPTSCTSPAASVGPAPAAVLGAIDRMPPPLLETLERVLWVQRYLYPPAVPQLAEVLAPQADALAAPLGALEQPAWPDDAAFIRERLLDVGRQTLEILAAFAAAARAADDLVELFRALRRFARVQETLY